MHRGKTAKDRVFGGKFFTANQRQHDKDDDDDDDDDEKDGGDFEWS